MSSCLYGLISRSHKYKLIFWQLDINLVPYLQFNVTWGAFNIIATRLSYVTLASLKNSASFWIQDMKVVLIDYLYPGTFVEKQMCT